jgi:hypothetical protein
MHAQLYPARGIRRHLKIVKVTVKETERNTGRNTDKDTEKEAKGLLRQNLMQKLMKQPPERWPRVRSGPGPVRVVSGRATWPIRS